MLDTPQNEKIEHTNLSTNLFNALNDSNEEPVKLGTSASSGADTSSAHLPSMVITNMDSTATQSNTEPAPRLNRFSQFLMPEEMAAPPGGEAAQLTDPELKGSIESKTQAALMKDADLYPPVQNVDGSTTYTVVQSGLTDRPGRDSGIDYYRRLVNITVPKDNPSIDKCQFVFNGRETISKDQYDQILQRDKAFNPEIELYAHGVSTTDMSADKQAMTLQLMSGRPTIALDWDANPATGDDNPLHSLQGYSQDTINAKRANDNKDFQNAIDNTVQEIGADHTSLIGFSHGGFFDTRYLAHRVQANLPKLENVILTHPDVPVSAPELRVNGSPELFKDSAQHSYVIGGKMDLAMKAAMVASHLLPGTPTYEGFFTTEERLGDDSNDTRSLIQQEGAIPISERDRPEPATEHFLNTAGITQILDGGAASQDQEQNYFNSATDMARLNLQIMSLMPNDMTPTEQGLLAS